MSDEGEKTCPLCAEEMDLTDQQLKPCKCGYEICVWCWHHIMDMAEKDNTEGRCPACRSPYNKQKIVGMAASCERLVAEMSMEKKVKSQKGKSKTTEGRKQLSCVRVIQRNLVYIVGLPLNLADEDLLQRKEYFAQYGKVLKVSVSRTAAGTIQQFANSTCSVYITYSKEDEAVRCIQSVHGFILEGRPLRACFGTTKYCHAWLRNVPCSNPDCLYLHEIGSQGDSFTKDEIISAYTRSRVQQITGATNSTERRSGNSLPPPTDDYCNNSPASSDKPITKSATSNSTSSTIISPPNSSSGRSVALPAGASWGTRPTINQQASGSLPASNGPLKHKLVTGNGPVTFSTALASSNQSPISHSDDVKKLGVIDDSTIEESKLTSEPAKNHIGADRLAGAFDASVTSAYHTTTTSSEPDSPPATRDKDKPGSLHPNTATAVDVSLESGEVGSQKVPKDDAVKKDKCSRSEMPSRGLDRHQGLEHGCADKITEPLTSRSVGTVVVPQKELCVSRSKSDLALEPEAPQTQVASVEDKDDVLSFEDQRLNDPELVSDSSLLPKISHSRHLSSIVRGFSPHLNSSLGVTDNFQIVDNKVDSISQSTDTPVFYSGYPEKQLNNFASLSNNVEHPCIFSHGEKPKNNRRFESELASHGRNGAVDNGESSIISNILSLDLDPWDESLTSPQNLAKLLGESDKQQRSLGVSSPWKAQQSNQSRFSFAREEEPIHQALGAESSFNYIDQAFRPNSYGREFTNKTSYHSDKFCTRNGFSFVNAAEPDPYSGFSSSKIPVSRSQVAAPPGFSTPNKAPPPGFTSHERLELAAMNSLSGHNMFEASSELRNQYQAPQSGNLVSNGDIEFMDPAILAVGKGRLPDGLYGSGLDMRSKFSPQLNTFENDARLQLLMQSSISSHQNPRFDMGDPFSSLSDSFRIPSRVMEQPLANSLSPYSQVGLPQPRNTLMSNGHWDSWNEMQGGNNMGMSELLRSERHGFNKFYTGYEDSKLRMPTQGDLYNRTFGL